MTRRKRRHWSRLPPELLERIAGAMDDVADRVRFGAVCKAWQTAASASGARLRPVLPWLHLPSPSSSNPTDLHSFFSLSSNRIYSLPLPPGTRSRAVYESSHGYVLTQDHNGMKNTVHLLNPITRTQLSLPPFPPLPPIVHCAVQRWKLITQPGRPSSDTDQRRSIMISVAFGPILICEMEGGGGEWGEWREISWVPIWTRLEFTFHRRNYFVLEGGTGQTSVVDPRSLEEVSVIPSVLGDHGLLDSAGSPHCHYLVESSSQEELYLVVMSLRATRDQERFEVFRLDRGGGGDPWQWIKVRTIGEDMMFVDYRNAVAVSATDFHGYRGSCIYFVDYGVHRPSLFDMESGGVEEVPNCWDDSSKRWKYHGWIIPTM